jgi:hypothetical protein
MQAQNDKSQKPMAGIPVKRFWQQDKYLPMPEPGKEARYIEPSDWYATGFQS